MNKEMEELESREDYDEGSSLSHTTKFPIGPEKDEFYTSEIELDWDWTIKTEWSELGDFQAALIDAHWGKLSECCYDMMVGEDARELFGYMDRQYRPWIIYNWRIRQDVWEKNDDLGSEME